MNKSENINELVAALAKAQAVMSNPVKDSQNPHFKNKYASLAACIEAVREPLSNNGLAVIQTTDVDGGLVLETTLAHSSGQWISSVYPINPVKNDPQGIGSAMSYARRYSFLAILNLKDEDDDAENAQGAHRTNEKEKTTDASGKAENVAQWGLKTQMESNWVGGPTQRQLKRLFAISKETNWSEDELRQYLEDLGLDSTKRLNQMQYEKLCDNMQKFPKEKQKENQSDAH